MKRTTGIVLLALMAIGFANVLAQDKKKKKPAANTQTASAPADTSLPVNDTSTGPTRFFNFPEFYSYWPFEDYDTLFKYECFDVHRNPIYMDTLHSFDAVHYITFVRIYNDYVHTSIDAEGRPRPRPVSKILYKYERTSAQMWMAYDCVHGQRSRLQEYPTEIVRRDTTVIAHPVTGGQRLTIRQYYKVEELEDPELQKENTQAGLLADSNTTIINHFVPEFYYHLARSDKDTTFEFFCYDNRDSLIPVTGDYDSVHYYSLYKTYPDPIHKFMDKDGTEKPMPIATIIKRYDRIGKDRWMSVEYPGNKYGELKEFKDVVVQVDTEMGTDAISGHVMMEIFSHYKVVPQ
jgi:hypothetical protein